MIIKIARIVFLSLQETPEQGEGLTDKWRASDGAWSAENSFLYSTGSRRIKEGKKTRTCLPAVILRNLSMIS
jgi:hypothetical protein